MGFGLVGVGPVVVVVVGDGNTGVNESPGAVVVGAKGPPTVVVVLATGPSAGRVLAVGSGKTGATPPVSGGGSAGAVASDRPVHQLTPIVTANARPPAKATMTRPEMSRPTRTLLRQEKPPDSVGVERERCSATRLARSSGLRRSRPYGSGNSAGPSSPSQPREKLRRRVVLVNDQ